MEFVRHGAESLKAFFEVMLVLVPSQIVSAEGFIQYMIQTLMQASETLLYNR